MKILFALLSIVLAQNVLGQVPPRDSVVGVWFCKEAKVMEPSGIPADRQEMIKEIVKAIQASRFEFKSNGLFEWHFQGKQSDFIQQLAFLNNRKWFVDQAKSVIRIGENLMEIQVSQKEGNTFFLLSETALLIQVAKKI